MWDIDLFMKDNETKKAIKNGILSVFNGFGR
jgi:hypothetical protein